MALGVRLACLFVSVVAVWDKRRRLELATAADMWLNGTASTPSSWNITASSQLDEWELLSEGTAKSVHVALYRGRRVIVKADRSSPRSHAFRGAAEGGERAGRQAEVTALRHQSELRAEVVYLEWLRGLPGVPDLLGGWREAGGGTTTYVVADAGTPIHVVQHASRNKDVTRYALLARRKPLALTRALLRCFQSFSEVGGFFLDDFAPHQFTFSGAPGSPRDPEVYLVDGPKALDAGPVRDLVAAMPKAHAIATVNAACATDADCPGTSRQHCCCCPHKEASGPMNDCGRRVLTPCADGSRGAPEARGACDARGRCARLSSRTHSFDFGAKAWLLPFLAESADLGKQPKTAAFLRRLATNMTARSPARRPAFSDAVRAVDDFARALDEGGGAYG